MSDNVDNPLYYGDIYSFLVRVDGTIRRYNKKGVYAIINDPTFELRPKRSLSGPAPTRT